MLISDLIAKMIEDLLDENDGFAEIKRNDLAESLGCVPSQINYVISSRFTPELGYIIESRRGGGGYIRIIRKQVSKDKYLMHFFCAIGDSIGESSANAFISNLYENSLLREREAEICRNVISSTSLVAADADKRDAVRAGIMKRIVLTLMEK